MASRFYLLRIAYEAKMQARVIITNGFELGAVGEPTARRGAQMSVSIEQVADAMYELVKEYKGKKQYTSRELTKTMMQKFGSECDKAVCKEALRLLMDSKRCVYIYKGSSYVALASEGGQE
jgi:hypothetical protein